MEQQKTPIKEKIPPSKDVTIKRSFLNVMIIIIAVMVIGSVALLNPAMTGFAIKEQFSDMNIDAGTVLKECDTIKGDFLAEKTNRQNCEVLSAKYLDEVNTEKNNAYVCVEKSKQLESQIENMKKECEHNIAVLSDDFQSKQNIATIEVNQYKSTTDLLNKNYNELVKNSANNICCKMRIDNSEIDSFAVVNNKITCGSGTPNKISC